MPSMSVTFLRLSIMMFLQFFIWGSWWVTLGSYMKAAGFESIIGITYSVQGWAALISPLLIGVIADRYFSPERLLGVLHLASGIMLYTLSKYTGHETGFIVVAFFCMLLYMPTLVLSASVTLAAVDSAEKSFAPIRLFGTLGWIAAGLAVGFLGLEQSSRTIEIAAAASLLLAIYSFLLPRTLPNRHGSSVSGSSRPDLRSLARQLKPEFWIFMGASLLICIPLSFYYAYANTFLVEKGVAGAAALQTLGQVSEVLFLLVLPWFLTRLGIRWVLLAGMIAWSLRYVLFSSADAVPEYFFILVVAGILIHGICYDFFFVAGQIYIDGALPAELRASGQAFLSLVTLGVGNIIGSTLANIVYVQASSEAAGTDWLAVWSVPAIFAAIVASLFFFGFRSKEVGSE
jgi:nucleoside transporter